LMEFFYEELSKGKSKTEALRIAKLKYLESTDDELLKHPYYWAAFTVSGDTTPLVKNSSWHYYTVFALLALVGLVYFRRKRNRAIAA